MRVFPFPPPDEDHGSGCGLALVLLITVVICACCGYLMLLGARCDTADDCGLLPRWEQGE
jgi:hypothetical protein